ncbi:hypothetical protein [Haloarcula quadrata]|uniref:hypothetical protein n=1 Tax=Haloarcula quadrata TaxID=182779 RepID=UPI001FC9AD0B|nr:hypothetical protein [Haloarcula quadrata]
MDSTTSESPSAARMFRALACLAAWGRTSVMASWDGTVEERVNLRRERASDVGGK